MFAELIAECRSIIEVATAAEKAETERVKALAKATRDAQKASEGDASMDAHGAAHKAWDDAKKAWHGDERKSELAKAHTAYHHRRSFGAGSDKDVPRVGISPDKPKPVK